MVSSGVWGGSTSPPARGDAADRGSAMGDHKGGHLQATAEPQLAAAAAALPALSLFPGLKLVPLLGEPDAVGCLL